MATQAKITKISDKSILIERLGKEGWTTMTYPADFRAKGDEQTGNVTLTANFPGFESVTLAPEEYEINGEQGTTVSETADKLNQFVGNFKPGGGSSEKTRVYDNGLVYISNGNIPNPRDGKTPDSAFGSIGEFIQYLENNIDVFYSKGYKVPTYAIYRELQLEAVTATTEMLLGGFAAIVLGGIDAVDIKGGRAIVQELKNKFVEVRSTVLRIAHIEGCHIKITPFEWAADYNSPIAIYEIKNSIIDFGRVAINSHIYFDASREIVLENSTLSFRHSAFENGAVPSAVRLRYGSKLVFKEDDQAVPVQSAFTIHKHDCSQIVWDNRQGKSFSDIYPNANIIEYGGTV